MTDMEATLLTPLKKKIACLVATGLILFVSGCGDTLVFMERTSLSLAAVNLNENVGEPVEVNVGFRRSVISFSPPVGGVEVFEGEFVPEGEAVSMLSGFKLAYDPPDGDLLPGDLTIKTQFASGNAAVAIADDPAIANRIMDVDFLVPPSEALLERRRAVSQFFAPGADLDQASIDALARLMREEPGLHARTNIRARIAKAGEAEVEAIAQATEIIFGRKP